MDSKIEQCLIIIKPDGLVKSITGNIISALSETKLKIVGAKIVSVPRELAEKHYAELKKKNPKVFENTINYIIGKFHTNRVLAMIYSGENAIKKVREIVGATNPEEASPISIRGKYGRINSKTGVYENAIHASNSKESAEHEIKMWFQPSELVEIIFPVRKQTKEQEILEWE